MRPRKFIAMVMTFLMMLSLLPSMVFAAAAPAGELGGKLKIKGKAAVGTELSADYSKATPEGLTDEYVSFSWSRKVGDEITEVGTEKTYKLTEEDLGNKIELKVTGLTEMEVTGELKAHTVEIVATPEEAPEETTKHLMEKIRRRKKLQMRILQKYQQKNPLLRIMQKYHQRKLLQM